MSAVSSNPFALLVEDDEAPVAAVATTAATSAPVKQIPKTLAEKAALDQAAKQQPKKAAAPANNGSAQKGNFSKGGKPSGPQGSTVPAGASVVSQGDDTKRHGQHPKRGQRGGWHGRGREMDRHSGMHRDSDKRTHQGWGESATTADDAHKNDSEIVQSTIVPGEEGIAVAVDGEATPVAVKEEEEVVKTLDEYLAEKASAKLVVEVKVRKANEGVDESKWGNVAPLKREEEILYPRDIAVMPKKKHVAKAKQFLEIEQKFPAIVREEQRSERGGRGGFRGGASRGSGRGGRGGFQGGAARSGGKTSAPSLESSSDFPQLAN